MREAINGAVQAGVVVVAAAGNEYTDVARVVPAALEGVVTVGATNSSDLRPSFSNFGEEIDVAAPGVNVWSTTPTVVTPAMVNPCSSTGGYCPISASYDDISGTSMAAPFVAGLAAMILSQDPTADYDDVLRRLRFSSVDLLPAGFDPYYGWGRIDAFKALSYDYYDNGSIKTQWLEEPDENGWTRLDFDTAGRLIGGSMAGAGAFGLGASAADVLADSFSMPSEIGHLEDFPRLIISPVLPLTGASKVSAPVAISKASFYRTPLGWSALGLRVQSYGEAKDERKEKKFDLFRFTRSKRGGRK
jgi:subtilisin family serine protease